MPESAESETRRFARLVIDGWRQFEHVDLEFHERLTVLTGANASGKTTILNILGRHFSWQTQFLGVPPTRAHSTWSIDKANRDSLNVGSLLYSNGAYAPITAHQNPSAAEYALIINGEQQVRGVFISSHRALSRYQRLETIPSSFSTSELMFQQFFQEIVSRYVNNYSQRTPLSALKEALVAAALYGQGNDAVEGNAEALEVWTDFQTALRTVLPASFGFVQLQVRAPEVVLVTESGDFLLDAVSGGISAMIELCWQLLLRSHDSPSFTVCIDEPENHLHPSLQRSLLPGLLEAFPRITFIVATHSPFIVTSVEDSNVYALTSQDGSVNSRLLDYANRAASADQTLREVLGLGSTMPIWVESALKEAIDRVAVEGGTAAALRNLQLALRAIGLEDEFPAAINALK